MAAATAVVALGASGSSADSLKATAAAKEVSVYPLPGSKYASPSTQISLRGATPSQLKGVRVSGSKSGTHSGTLKAHSDGKGASFIPRTIFRNHETVTVRVARPVAGVSGTVAHFKIDKPINLHEIPQGAQTGRKGVEAFKSQPDLQPSKVKVNTSAAGQSSGYFFVSPKAGPSQGGPMIVDGNGQLVWFQPMPSNFQSFDFHVQTYKGKNVLTWWQGQQIGGHGLAGSGLIYDGDYKLLKRVKAGNGFLGDIHEFTITPRGTAWILAYNPVHANLKSVGGPTNGTAYDAVVQEIDIETGLVLFEWHGLDHVKVNESYIAFQKGEPFDAMHVNSAADIDNDLLLSARSTWTIYRIDRATGKIEWRLNGKHSTFKMGAGAAFAYQHDARQRGKTEVTLFDNHAAVPAKGVESRGLVLKLNTKSRKATLVKAYPHPRHILSPSQGNLQILANGHAVVGWGGNNENFSEFSAAGVLLYDASFVTLGDNSYRAYRQTWKGFAPGDPAVVANTALGQTKVYASWNGATKVTQWRVLGGATATSLIALGTFPRTGFETTMTILTPQAFVQVEALSAAGKVLGRSKATASTPG